MTCGPSLRSTRLYSHPFSLLDQFADFPFQDFTQPNEISKEINSVFDSLIQRPFTMTHASSLKMDLVENEKEFVANFDVPGLEKEAVKVTVEKNVLTVSVEHAHEEAHDDSPSEPTQAEGSPVTTDEEKNKPEVASTGVSEDSKVTTESVEPAPSGSAPVVKLHNEESKGPQTKVHWRERRIHSYGHASRSVALPKTADLEQIKAVQQDGVLTVTIPKQELPPAEVPRQIQIE